MTRKTAIYEKKSVLNHTDVGVGCSHNRNFFFWVLLIIFNTVLSFFPFSINSAFGSSWYVTHYSIWQFLLFRSIYTNLPVFGNLTGHCCCRCEQTNLGHTELPEGHSVEPMVPFAPALCSTSKQDCDCRSLVCQLFYLENKQMQQDQMENTSNATNQTSLNHLQKCCLTCISRR